MAQGDIVSDLQDIASGAYLDVQPDADVEWVVHNIYHESDISVCWYDGTNNLVALTEIGPGVMAYYSFHCTNGLRIRLRNDNVASKLIGYDGVATST